VATTPTWSGLGAKRGLLPEGASLWRKLVDLLAPDVVLVSFARDYLRHFAPAEWAVFQSIPWKPRSDVLRGEATVGRRRVPVFFGPNINIPYGSLSAEEKEQLGVRIRESLA
jgi:hypothetical protein